MNNPPHAEFEMVFDNSPPDPKKAPPIPDHTLLKHIGSGAYGDVWLAKNVMGTFRAVKIVFRNSFSDMRPYERELAGIQKFEPISRTHEGLVDILQVGCSEKHGYFYYVMELGDDRATGQQINPENYKARTLSSDLRLRGRFPIEECVKLSLTMCDALGHLHKNGLLHRDIKPANIIFVHGVPKLADIGLVVEAKDARTFVGTDGFIPPEGPSTVQADIYSLGKVIYEMATGNDRCDYPALPTITNADSSAELLELHEVVTKACDTDVKKRYQDCDALYSDLVIVQSGRSLRHLRGVETKLAILTKISVGIIIASAIAIGAVFYQKEKAREAMDTWKREADLRQLAELHKADAEVSDAESQQRLYAARINLAQQAYQRGEIARLKDLLESLRPRAGKEDLRGFEWHYLHRLLYSDNVQLQAHLGGVRALGYSPDGKFLATGGTNSVIRIWDSATGLPYQELSGHVGVVNSVAFSPDGKFLASGGDDQKVKIWDLETETVRTFDQGYTNSCLAFSPDGHILAAASGRPGRGDGLSTERFAPPVSTKDREEGKCDVKLWEGTTGNLKGRLLGHSNGVMSVAFSPDGESIATASVDGTVKLWDAATQTERHTIAWHREGPVFCVAFSPDGKYIASAGNDRMAAIWDAETGDLRGVLSGHNGPVFSVAFSRDGKKVATGSYDRTARLWNAEDGTEVSCFRGHARYIWALAFSPDVNSEILATASGDGWVNLWGPKQKEFDFITTKEKPSLEGGAKTLAFSHDSKTLAVGCVGVTILDPADLKIRAAFTNDYEGGRVVVAISSRGQIAAIGTNGLLKTWDAATFKSGFTIQAHTNRVWALGFSRDGQWLATGSDSGEVKVWNAETGKLEWLQPHVMEFVRALTFSPDGKELVITGRKRAAHQALLFWNLAERKLRNELRIPLRNAVITYSPDGKTFATAEVMANEERVVKLWDAKTEKVREPHLSGHGDVIYSAAFSPDSKTLATACWDGTVRLWHVATGAELLTLDTKNLMADVAFSPDGRQLIGACERNIFPGVAIIRWRADRSDLSAELK